MSVCLADRAGEDLGELEDRRRRSRRSRRVRQRARAVSLTRRWRRAASGNRSCVPRTGCKGGIRNFSGQPVLPGRWPSKDSGQSSVCRRRARSLSAVYPLLNHLLIDFPLFLSSSLPVSGLCHHSYPHWWGAGWMNLGGIRYRRSDRPRLHQLLDGFVGAALYLTALFVSGQDAPLITSFQSFLMRTAATAAVSKKRGAVHPRTVTGTFDRHPCRCRSLVVIVLRTRRNCIAIPRGCGQVCPEACARQAQICDRS